jgi:outer membrane immunogenic protein
MVRLARIICALIGISSPALAADLPPPAAPRAPAVYVPAVVPVYNWAGIYIGVNGGYGFGSSTWTDPNNLSGTTTSGSFNTNGGLVGGTLGVNFQTGGLVLGVEGDIDWQSLKGSSSNAFCTGVFSPADLNCQTKSNWVGTVRGRVGYAADRFLFYATGGGAYGNVEASLTGLPFQSSTEFGWTAGAGVEVAFAENWTAKIEYLYVDLGNNASCNTSASCGFDAAGVAANDSVKFTESMIRGGVNFKFNF